MPICPTCYKELDMDRCDEYYVDENIIVPCVGYCPICRKVYRWEEEYKYAGYYAFERIE